MLKIHRPKFIMASFVALIIVGLAASSMAGEVLSGLDVLARDNFKQLEGRKIGLIVNHSSLTRDGVHSLDLLHQAENVEIVAIFTPEHGIRGTEDRHVEGGKDEKTGLPIHSLYGKTRRPSAEMVADIDTFVFDIQDIGARFYTYIATMGNCMEVSVENDIKFFVLDRPNPIRGTWFDGPIQDDEFVGKFTNFRHMPTVHGMTVGEMALFFNKVSGRMQSGPGIGADLTVVEMEGWDRGMLYDETGLPWVNPSPNMRSVQQELLYTMVALVEANKEYSVGRGTERPFEYVGAPGMDADALVKEMRAANLPGLWIMQETFMPRATDVSGRKNYPYQFTEEVCDGARFVLSDRDAFEPLPAGIVMLAALKKTAPDRWNTQKLHGLVGAQWVLDALDAGTPPMEIVEKWRASEEFKAFAKARKAALIY